MNARTIGGLLFGVMLGGCSASQTCTSIARSDVGSILSPMNGATAVPRANAVVIYSGDMPFTIELGGYGALPRAPLPSPLPTYFTVPLGETLYAAALPTLAPGTSYSLASDAVTASCGVSKTEGTGVFSEFTTQ